ncbi:MAG: RNA polymerase sigma-70 factor [Prevotellaceae bacterium]|nr:RNA polymerase sigma-70 factor [Prevotellaceae bacterium]
MDFEKIYIAHFAKMKRFAKEYVLSGEEAENIVQGVFLELWEKKEILSMPVNLIAFLFTAVKNRCLDYLRHQVVVKETKNKLQEEQRIMLRMKFNSLEAFDQSIFSEKDIETVLFKAIATLPEKCREIFIKSRIKGEKQKDIARELNISIHTVETQMNIAYKKLRTELKNYLPLLLFLF